MTYQQLMYVVHNKNFFTYDNATSGGSDNSTDASAAYLNPNNYLAPTIQQRSFIRILVIVVLILLSIFLIKKIIK